MSLDWSITKVRDWEEIANDENESVITDCLVWGAMFVDMGSITNKNWGEFYGRIKFWEDRYGALMKAGDGSAIPVTPEMVKRRIGLHTNVLTMSRTAWANKRAKMFKEDLNNTINRSLREVEES